MPPPTRRSSRSIVWLPLVLVSLAAGFVLGGLCVHFFYDQRETGTMGTGSAATDSSRPVVALGRIEPRDGILSLGVPAPDRIREINVREDDIVEAGKCLVILESQKMRQLEEEMAAIQLRDARTRLEAIEKNGKAQIAVARLRRDRVKKLGPIETKILQNKKDLLVKQEENAARNYARYRNAGDTISDMDKEKQELTQQQIETEIADTKEQIHKLEQSSKLDYSLAEAQLQATEAELQQTQSTISPEALGKQVEQAEERLQESELRAPSHGTILRVFAHKGDLVQSKPILQMANVDKMIVLAEVDEKDIKRVEIGQAATITSSSGAIDGNECARVRGKVIWKATYVGKAEMIPLDPRAAVSDRVIHVKIAVDEPKCVAKLIGLQVQVKIHTSEAPEPAR